MVYLLKLAAIGRSVRWGRRFARDERGLSAVEYAIAGALVIGVAAGAFVALGTNVNDRVNTMADCVQGPDTCPK